MHLLEFIATLFGLIYLVLITFHKRLGWIFGCLSSVLYVIICTQNTFYIQACLQFIYVILGAIGFLNWNNDQKVVFRNSSVKTHIQLILLGIILSLILGNLFKITDQKLPYWDATISIFSILATILAVKSIIENWYYWFFVNLLSIYMFVSQGLYITSFLYFIYLIGSIFGLYQWKRLKKSQAKK